MMQFFCFMSLIWSAVACGSRIDHSTPKEYYPVEHGTGNSIDLLFIIIEHRPNTSPHRGGSAPGPNFDIRPTLPNDRDTHRGSKNPDYFNDHYAEFMHRGPETFDPSQFPGYGNAFPYGADYSYAFRESNFEKRERAQHELDSYLADGAEEQIKRDQRDCQLADQSIQRMKDFVEKRNTFVEGIEHLDHSDQRRAVVDTASSVMRAAKESFIDNDPLEWFEAGATMAETLLDLAIDFTPGASWGKDLYESITGKSLVTGERLDEFTHSMCVFGALTLGFGSKVKHAIKVLGRTRGAATIGKSYEAGKGLFKSLKHLFKKGGKKPSQIINEIGDSAKKLEGGAKEGIKWAAKSSKNADDMIGVIDSTAAVGAKSASRVQNAKKLVGDFLGEGTVVKTNKHGDKIFLSKDGTRKVRFDVKNSHGDKPHMHFEKKNSSGKWVDEIDGKHRVRFDGQ